MNYLKALRPTKVRAAEERVRRRHFDDFDSLCEETRIAFNDALVADTISYVISAHRGLPADEAKSAMDAFLAPRVHGLFRMHPSAAASPGLWVWCAARPMRRYMEERWPLSEEGTAWRYLSNNPLRNGVARLWWAAEMLRSGADYTLVPIALKKVRRFQFVSELRYSMYRECARAFTRVCEDRDLSDEPTKELSKRLNVYLRARVLELWDESAELSSNHPDERWLSKQPNLTELTGPLEELSGPSTGISRPDVEEEIYEWLLEILDE